MGAGVIVQVCVWRGELRGLYVCLQHFVSVCGLAGMQGQRGAMLLPPGTSPRVFFRRCSLPTPDLGRRRVANKISDSPFYFYLALFPGGPSIARQVAELLAELDPVIFVLDCEFNMVKYVGADHPAGSLDWRVIECLTVDFITILRKARPDTPVLLIEGHDETVNWMHTNGGEDSRPRSPNHRPDHHRVSN